MVTQKEIIEALRDAGNLIIDWGAYASPFFQEKHGLMIDAHRFDELIAKIESEGIAPPDGHIIVPTCAVRRKPYVPMTDLDWRLFIHHARYDGWSLQHLKQVEAAVIKRAGLEVKHD